MLIVQSEKLLNSKKLVLISGFVYNKVIMCNSFDYTAAYINVFLHVLCKKVWLWCKKVSNCGRFGLSFK